MMIILFLSQFWWASTTAAAATSNLEGRWVQACQNQTLRTEDFAQDHVTLSEFYFADRACTQKFLTFINHGEFEISNDFHMDFTFKQVRIQIASLDLVTEWNSRSVCGFNDWKLNQEKDVTGLLCELFGEGSLMQIPELGQKRYGIFQVRGDELYFGRLTPEFDALSPDRRPREFDPRFYRRQP